MTGDAYLENPYGKACRWLLVSSPFGVGPVLGLQIAAADFNSSRRRQLEAGGGDMKTGGGLPATAAAGEEPVGGTSPVADCTSH